MTKAHRQAVRKRAGNRCEYCHIHQDDMPFVRHHIEHIVPRQHGGTDDLGNLALACHRCNRFKGPNLSALDPRTGKLVPLFHPRRQRWRDHFLLHGTHISGRTAFGRATVELLQMNATRRRNLRHEINP